MLGGSDLLPVVATTGERGVDLWQDEPDPFAIRGWDWLLAVVVLAGWAVLYVAGASAIWLRLVV